MGLIDQLARALAQGAPVEVDTPQALWAEAAESLRCNTSDHDECNAALADVLDETRATCEGWRTGSQYRLDTLLCYIRLRRLPDLARNDDALSISAIDHEDRPGVQRKGSLQLHTGTMTTVVNLYVAGDYDGAAQALVDGMEDSWYYRQYAGTLATERAQRAGGQ